MTHLQSKAVQEKTAKALSAINQGRWTVGRDLIAKTRDPLASKLYYWLLFTEEKGNHHFIRLAQFIRSNPEWPGIKGLRKQAEDSMPANLKSADVIAWFDDYPPQTAAGMDRYLQALIITGRVEKAKEYLRNWWAKTPLSRESQRNIYRKYSKFIDSEAHKKRFDTLLFASQYTNARAVARVLGKGYPELAEARIALAEEKSGVNGRINKVPKELQNDAGLLYERLRWRRRKGMDFRAMEILHNTPPADQISNPESWWRERHILIRRLLEKKHHESAYLLALDHVQTDGFSYAQAQWLLGWLSLRFVDKPAEAFQYFEALYARVKTPVSKARAAYWAGRAADAFGENMMSAEWFEKAARFQTVYYGQLARAELTLSEELPKSPPPTLTKQDKKDFNKRELVQAARLFHKAGMRREASRFIQAFVKHDSTPKGYRFGAELAAGLGHYHDAIRISKNATKQGMFLTKQSYPVITDRLKKVDVEWALVHGLIRQESMFDFKAESPAGALGLMQLMPGTAKDVARKMGIRHTTGKLLSNPDHNIRLGSRYLSDMLRRFDGSYPLAIAAYNAGPARVDRWLKTFGDPRTGDVDFIDWVELIPIYETRNYVQRVMEAIYVYRLRLEGVQEKPDTPIHIAMPYKP